ncbi:hypothetical protein NHX12_012062 [Muraenolepis orangiensis]|uniref:Solute carrier family 49 member 3 n=1 Tax=Muraenolepis orangiensis TaxID=630683 RepID=A0A9Q0DK40_9TELE|nr:hypothetical protein NHX12_012062 [Muraenolepis orangiensis]
MDLKGDLVPGVPSLSPGEPSPGPPVFTVYRRRWLVLLVLCLLNCSNSALWLTFAPVADQSARYLKATLDQVNWLSLVYMVLILGSWLNMLGAVLRVLGTLESVGQGEPYALVMSGQTLCAVAQPLVIFAPTKMAALWFPEHQRATANMIASMSNPVGLLVANILSPLIATTDDRIPLLLLVYAVPACLVCFLATVGLRSSGPPTPPPQAAAEEPYFAGLCGSLFIVFGVIGAGLLGLFVDRTKMFTEVTKVNLALSALACIAFAVEVAVAVACSFFGLFGFSIYPVAMELCVECTFPVGEAASTGLIFISGQVQSVVLMVALQALTRPLADSPFSTCSAGDSAALSWRVSVLVMAGVFSLLSCFFILVFDTPYRRVQAEAAAAAQKPGWSTPDAIATVSQAVSQGTPELLLEHGEYGEPARGGGGGPLEPHHMKTPENPVHGETVWTK